MYERVLMQISLPADTKRRVIAAAGGPRKVSAWVHRAILAYLAPEAGPVEHAHVYGETVRKFGALRQFCTDPDCRHFRIVSENDRSN